MITLLHAKLSMLVVLAILSFVLAWSLIRRSRSDQSGINLDDLLLGEDGKISKAAAVMLGSFVMTSWVIVYLTLTNKLTEGYFGAYLLAWVSPTVTKLIKGPSVTTTTTNISAQVGSTPPPTP
jgi:hypothetical protein